MAKGQTVIFNLDDVIEILRKGVRRADVFMGIGLNAAEADPAISHVLSPDNLHRIDLVKTHLTLEEQAHIASEFGKWVRANGLRELIETVSLFLDNLYLPIFIMRQRDNNECKQIKNPDRFERLGIIDKVKIISTLIPINDEMKNILGVMNRVRNCYAHRRGVVGNIDLDRACDVMTIRWLALDIQVEEPDGKLIPESELYNRVLVNGGNVQIKVVERTRCFRAGSEIILEKRDLKEMCFSISLIGQQIFDNMVAEARKSGLLQVE